MYVDLTTYKHFMLIIMLMRRVNLHTSVTALYSRKIVLNDFWWLKLSWCEVCTFVNSCFCFFSIFSSRDWYMYLDFVRSVPRHELLKGMLEKLYAEKQTDWSQQLSFLVHVVEALFKGIWLLNRISVIFVPHLEAQAFCLLGELMVLGLLANFVGSKFSGHFDIGTTTRYVIQLSCCL